MKFRTTLKGASAPIALCVAMLATPVMAQDAEDVLITDEEEEAAAADGETIFVTGSRIRRNEFTAPAPLTVINPEIAVRQGLNDTGSMIQGSPIAAGSSQVTAALSSQFLVNGGQGVQTVSLRGLGAERTLVLLNGRRAGPAGTRGAVSAFDLNVLPQSIVEQVEILKDGASSIYGSDAVAGVVNLITKRDTDGIEFDFFGSVPQDSGGETWSASATWGTTFDRGHIMISANYYRQNELERGDRDYLGCSEAYVFTGLDLETRADLIDPRTGEISCNGAQSNNTWGHVWTYDYSYYYSPNGTNVPGSAGTGAATLFQFSYPGDNLGRYIPAASTPLDPSQISVPAGWFPVGYDAASRAVYNNYHPTMDRDSIIPTVDRYTLYLDAAYELAEGFELYTELLYNKRESYFDGSGQIWQFGVGATNGGLFGPTTVDRTAVGFGGAATFSPTGFIDWYDSSQEVQYYRAVAGVRGDISSSFQYDLYGQYSLSDGDYSNQVVLNDSIRTQDFRTDGNAPNGFRTARCPAGRTPIGNKACTFVDWYSPRVMYGDYTAAEFDFLTDTDTGNTQFTQWYVEGVVSGDLFSLWGNGPIGIAVGGTFRRDDINDVPGPITLAGNVWQGLGAGVTAGYSDTSEAFGEISIPLLADIPFIESFDLTAAARITNVKAVRDSDGTSFSDNGNITYKLGADWEVTDWLRFRATYGTSFRAPALFEQFLADQEGSLSQRSLDPCIGWGVALTRGDISQQFANNCAADGVAPNHTGSGIDGVVITGGGLGVLEPETSTAWTASMVLTPSFSFLPDTQISVAVDYFDIEVKGQIAQFGARNVVSSCYNSDFYPTDPLCTLFARVGDLDEDNPFYNDGSPTNIAFVRDSFININSQKNRGVDVTTRIEHDFSGDTTLSFQAQMTWQTKDEIAVFASTPQSLNGEAGEPKWVGDFNVQLDTGPWNFFYSLDVLSGTDDTQDFVERNTGLVFDDLTQAQIDAAMCRRFTTYNAPVCFDLTIPTRAYHSVSITREIGDNLRITAGVSNLLNSNPPRVSDVGGDGINTLGQGVLYSQYDIIGRRGFINLNLRY